MTNGSKTRALDAAILQIRKQYGDGALMRLGEATHMAIEAIPTGSLALDIALGIGGVPRGRVTVALATSGKSWVSVTTSNGRQLFQGLLQDGSHRSFTDPTRLRFVIGNAGAVSLTVNGSHLGASGRPGQVARLAFTPTDPAQG